MARTKIFLRGRQEKAKIIIDFFPELFSKKILDVGCGDCYLKKLVKGDYVGIDKYGSPDIKQDISNGLPFENQSFDTVLSLDVLEHIDNIHFLFNELCRVADRWVIVALPNMYEWRFRSFFLLGKSISGKYGLPENPPLDRHRWIFSLKDSKNFIQKNAEKNNFKVSKEVVCFYKYNKLFPRIITKIGSYFNGRFDNLFASRYLAVLKRQN